MAQRGFVVAGTPSPIVPVFVGDEGMSRRTSREMMTCGLAANLVEFPAVPLGTARFRFQLMSTHTADQITEAARLREEARRKAAATLSTGEQASE